MMLPEKPSIYWRAFILAAFTAGCWAALLALAVTV